MFKCGMYGGSFNPLHLGHVACIIRAAGMCERLIVVISEGRLRDEIDVRIRYRWVYEVTSHIGNVEIFVLSDDAPSKGEYGEELWMADAERVKKFAGERIDAVFCGSDYGEDSWWGKCYPEARLVIFRRNEISSTAIRRDPYGHWDMLPNVVKPHYVKRVLVTGSESSGKSTLARNLANYFNTNLLEEVGRDMSERSGTDEMMLRGDFTDILLTHKLLERSLMRTSRMVLFEDTDCLVTKFFMEFLGASDERNEALADAIAGLNSYDLILFLEPDVRFVDDGSRSRIIASDRERYSGRLKEIYLGAGFRLTEIRGSYDERFTKSVELVEKMLGRGKP